MAQFRKSSRNAFLNILRKTFVLQAIAKKDQNPGLTELLEMSKEKNLELPRRKFLRDVSRAGMLLGAAGFIESCRKTESLLAAPNRIGSERKDLSEKYRIAIIGGGLAGLNCAYQLKKSGYSSTVYEASERIGGRVLTLNNVLNNGCYTEAGGEFIDTGHKHMRNLADEFGLTLVDTQTKSEKELEGDVFYIEGNFYHENDIVNAFAPYAKQISADISSLPNYFGFNNYTADVQRFDMLSISRYLDSLGMPSSGFLRKGIEAAYLTEYGREVNDQTAINFLFLFTINAGTNQYSIFGLSDERYKVEGGNQQVAQSLYDEISAQVQMGYVLQKITRSASGVYTIHFANGKSVSADLVVITIPFTMLKSVDLSNLNFPSWKTNAIQNLGYGTNAKLLLGYNKRIWRDYKYSGYAFSNGIAAGSSVHIQNGWDNSLMQAGTKGGYTVFQGGKQGLNLSTSQTSIFVDQMEKMWPGAKTQFNGTSKLIHWPSHPFTRGSYACWRVGQVTTISGAEVLPVDNVYFAGEHCSAWNQGYMEGAVETGYNAAAEIVKSLSKTS